MNKKLFAGASLLALAMVGGTYAYFNQSLQIENPLSTGSYGTVMYENYTPPADDMVPGQHWDKTVGATNTGDYPVLVRVKMDEKWQRKGTTGDPYKAIASSDDGFRAGEYSAADGVFDAAQLDDGDGLTPAGDPEDGDGTVVFKNIKDESGSKWVYGGDGYWYYNEVLAEGKSTDLLLDGLVMATDIDLGSYDPHEYYFIGEEGMSQDDLAKVKWEEVDYGTLDDANADGVKDIRDVAFANGVGVAGGAHENDTIYRQSTSELNEALPGYSESDYTLTITSEFVQANQDAVAATWFGNDSAKTSEALAKLDGISLDEANSKNLQ